MFSSSGHEGPPATWAPPMCIIEHDTGTDCGWVSVLVVPPALTGNNTNKSTGMALYP